MAYVDDAFAKRAVGDTLKYWDLVAQFKSSASSLRNTSRAHVLSLWLLALSHHVSKLDSASHGELVESILAMPWAGANEDFVRSWSRFVCALVSARLEWAGIVLGKLVKALRWRSDWVPLPPSNFLSNDAPSDLGTIPLPTRRLLYRRFHLLLRAILTLIPTITSTLNPLLARHYPHRRAGKKAEATYVRNILYITRYEPQVAETVWRLVADRAIGLDVQIQIELDELDEGIEDAAEGDEHDATSDPLDKIIDEDSSSDSGSDSDDDDDGGSLKDMSDEEGDAKEDTNGGPQKGLEEEKRERKLRELVGKLDAMMQVCFEHLETVGTVAGKSKSAGELILDSRPSWLSEFLGSGNLAGANLTPTTERPQSQVSLQIKKEADNLNTLNQGQPTDAEEEDEAFEASKDALFHHLLHLFSRSILPTFKCRHVQFLLFWYCSLEQDFSDFFLGFLIHKAIYTGTTDTNQQQQQIDQSMYERDRSTGSSKTEPMVLRQASASYVASFVSRARYISPSYTRTVVFNLCSYLEAHLEAHSNAIAAINLVGLQGVADEKTRRLGSAQPGNEEHAIFYAVAQAVFYIFCFRWKDLQLGGSSSTHRGTGDGQQHGSGLVKEEVDTDEEIDDDEVDAGLMIGSLSSTGSSYALPSSFRREHRHSTQGSNANKLSSSITSSTASERHRTSALPSINVEPSTTDATSLAATSSHWSPGLSILQRAILSPLNPLQFCSSTVVRQFASVAQHVGFLYCWSVIEANRRAAGGSSHVGGPAQKEGRSGQSQQTEGATAGSSASVLPGSKAPLPNNGSIGITGGPNSSAAFLTKDLEGFFPFDPYRLKATEDRFVRELYREWSEVAPVGLGDGEEEDSDEESMTEGEEEEESDQDEIQRKVEGLNIPGAQPRRRNNSQRRPAGSLSSSSATGTSMTSENESGMGGQEDEFAKGMEAMSVSAG